MYQGNSKLEMLRKLIFKFSIELVDSYILRLILKRKK